MLIRIYIDTGEFGFGCTVHIHVKRFVGGVVDLDLDLDVQRHLTLNVLFNLGLDVDMNI
jgi:hypothetical protein